MKLTRLLKISVITTSVLLLLYFGLFFYRRFLGQDRLKDEANKAVQPFRSKEQAYDDVLQNWSRVVARGCDSMVAIKREKDGALLLIVGTDAVDGLSAQEVATRLKVRREDVLATIRALSVVDSQEIYQVGGAVKVMSPESDVRGYVHVDSSCRDAANYEFWSKQPNNFTVDNPGSYLGLKGLGNGWYYYLEQR